MIYYTLPLHHQAGNLREKGKFLDALKLYEEVILNYSSNDDYEHLIEALLDKSLTYKHLNFPVIAKHTVLAALEIAQKFFPKKIFHCFFRLGEMELILKNYQAAVDNYTQALNLFPEDNAEKGDLIYHLGEAQILAGDQTIGADNLKLGQTTIEKYQDTTDSFCYDVWLSGCLMKQALYLHDQTALDQAEKIIAANPRLILRRQQLDALKSSIPS